MNLKKIDHYFYVITEIKENRQTLRSSSYSLFFVHSWTIYFQKRFSTFALDQNLDCARIDFVLIDRSKFGERGHMSI